MKTYTVTEVTGVTIHSGILLLNDLQATARVNALINLGEGLYEIRGPVQFKCRETFGYDGEVNKALLEKIVEVEVHLPGSKPAKQNRAKA